MDILATSAPLISKNSQTDLSEPSTKTGKTRADKVAVRFYVSNDRFISHLIYEWLNAPFVNMCTGQIIVPPHLGHATDHKIAQLGILLP